MAAKPYRVCLLGASLDNPNRGVGALAASLIALIARERPEAEFYSLYGSRTEHPTSLRVADRVIPITCVAYRQSFRCSPRKHILVILFAALAYHLLPFRWFRRNLCAAIPWIAALDQADFIGEIRGGDSFSDLYGRSNFLLGVLPTLTPLLMGKPLVLLPQTYLPFRTRTARWMARWIMRHAHRIYARDQQSVATARALLNFPKGEFPNDTGNIVFCPDVAFALEAQPPPPREMFCGTGDHLVGININGMLYAQSGGESSFGIRDQYGRFIQLLVKTILQSPHTHILLVPHVFSGRAQDDLAPSLEVCDHVPEALRKLVHVIDRPLTAAELKGYINLCEFFVGSRMHACIASLSQGIPCVGVAYSGKFAGVFETVGARDWVLEASALPAEDLVAAVMKKWRAVETHPPLKPQVEATQRALRQQFAAMLHEDAEKEEQLHPSMAARELKG